MNTLIAWLDGKTTYLLVIVYIVLQLAQGADPNLPIPENLSEITLAAAVAALRRGVAKVSS